jgi:hypothetical protein
MELNILRKFPLPAREVDAWKGLPYVHIPIWSCDACSFRNFQHLGSCPFSPLYCIKYFAFNIRNWYLSEKPKLQLRSVENRPESNALVLFIVHRCIVSRSHSIHRSRYPCEEKISRARLPQPSLLRLFSTVTYVLPWKSTSEMCRNKGLRRD